VQLVAYGVRQGRRGRLLEHLLVAALRGTVAVAQDVHAAPPVAEDLHLDVAATGDIALDEQARVAERAGCLLGRAVECRRQRALRPAQHQPDAAAAGRAFQHHGIADLGHRPPGRIQVRQQPAAGREPHAGGPGDLTRTVLQAEVADLRRSRAYEDQARTSARLGEIGVLGQETVAGVNGIGAGVPCRLQHAVDPEIALAGGGRADAPCLARRRHMRGMAVRLGINGDRRHIHPAQRAEDAAGGGDAVGGQDPAEQPGAAVLRHRAGPVERLV